MGANAQTTVPTFTASQVLTADEMNQSARTGVPVFATTGTRDAAFGGAGEKTLAEGQMCYVEGTGFQTYNGTAWVTWGTSPSGGLDLISSTTIGNAVSSVTVSNAFSSTYDNYMIWISGGVASASINLNLTLGSTATGYYNLGYFAAYGAAALSIATTVNGTSWVGGASGTTNSLFGIYELSNPFASKRTHIRATAAQSDTVGNAAHFSGYLNDNTSYTAFTITTASGTMTGGTVKVYGYKN